MLVPNSVIISVRKSNCQEIQMEEGLLLASRTVEDFGEAAAARGGPIYHVLVGEKK